MSTTKGNAIYKFAAESEENTALLEERTNFIRSHLNTLERQSIDGNINYDIMPNVDTARVQDEVLNPLYSRMIKGGYLDEARKYNIYCADLQMTLAAWLGDLMIIFDIYKDEPGATVAKNMLLWLTDRAIQIQYAGDDNGCYPKFPIEGDLYVTVSRDGKLHCFKSGELHDMINALVYPALDSLVKIINESKVSITPDNAAKYMNKDIRWLLTHSSDGIDNILDLIFNKDYTDAATSEDEDSTERMTFVEWEAYFNKTFEERLASFSPGIYDTIRQTYEGACTSGKGVSTQNESGEWNYEATDLDKFNSAISEYLSLQYDIGYDSAEDIADAFDFTDKADIDIVACMMNESLGFVDEIRMYIRKYADKESKQDQVKYLMEGCKKNNIDPMMSNQECCIYKIKESACNALNELIGFVTLSGKYSDYIAYYPKSTQYGNDPHVNILDRIVFNACQSCIAEIKSSMLSAGYVLQYYFTTPCVICHIDTIGDIKQITPGGSIVTVKYDDGYKVWADRSGDPCVAELKEHIAKVMEVVMAANSKVAEIVNTVQNNN